MPNCRAPARVCRAQAREKRKGNSQRGVNKSSASCLQDFVQIHSEAERDDGALQERARDAAALVDVGMRKTQPENDSYGESDWRGKQSRERKRERENKNNFRESGHRPEREYQ